MYITRNPSETCTSITRGQSSTFIAMISHDGLSLNNIIIMAFVALMIIMMMMMMSNRGNSSSHDLKI